MHGLLDGEVAAVAPILAGYPARAGGPWLCSTCPHGERASVVPSGCKIIAQPHRCTHT